jgi:acyl carrier protein
VLGTIAQANYVAGNSFMDSLARYRNEIGLPGLSINWGALGGAGMVERDAELQKYMDQAGFGQVPLKDSLKALDVLMRKGRPQVTCLKINWQKYARANPHAANQPRLAEVMSGKRAAGGAARQQVLDAPQGQRVAVVVQYLRELVSTVLKVDPAKIDANEPLRRLGLDSLASFQLKNRIESDHGITLDVSTFLQNPNVTKLSEMMVNAIEATSSGASGGTHEARSEGQLSIRQKTILAEFDNPNTSPAALQSYEVTAACVVQPRIDLSLFRQAFDRQVDESCARAFRCATDAGASTSPRSMRSASK